ncbi:hypothetical protein [Acinetobacter soli]|uniref:hypothetical protein n=1 Tax=Acinetobacter soli TaxID=487316 RepID=UPI001D181CA1
MSETLKVKPSHASQGKFVIISVDQYDPSVHELIEGESLPDSLVQLDALITVDQFNAVAIKLAETEDQLKTSQGEFIAFQNDVAAMKARIVELEVGSDLSGAGGEVQKQQSKTSKSKDQE